jgi:hypothetical protein
MATIRSTITMNIGNTNTIPIPFKEVWSDNIKNYQVDPLWTTRQLMENIRTQVEIDFGTSNFELVVSGQNVAIPEMAQALPINDNIILKNDILGREMRIITIYIRKLNYQYPQMANLA